MPQVAHTVEDKIRAATNKVNDAHNTIYDPIFNLFTNLQAQKGARDRRTGRQADSTALSRFNPRKHAS